MGDAVDVLECKQAANVADETASPALGDHIFASVEAAIEAWLADGGTPAQYDRTYVTGLGSNRKAVVIEYTTAA